MIRGTASLHARQRVERHIEAVHFSLWTSYEASHESGWCWSEARCCNSKWNSCAFCIRLLLTLSPTRGCLYGHPVGWRHELSTLPSATHSIITVNMKQMHSWKDTKDDVVSEGSVVLSIPVLWRQHFPLLVHLTSLPALSSWHHLSLHFPHIWLNF